jgi:hypothetical protein
MSETEVVNSLLLPLADLFESGVTNRFVEINPELCRDTYEIEREWLATAVAERWLVRFGKTCYQFTPEGYLQFKARIRALRELN